MFRVGTAVDKEGPVEIAAGRALISCNGSKCNNAPVLGVKFSSLANAERIFSRWAVVRCFASLIEGHSQPTFCRKSSTREVGGSSFVAPTSGSTVLVFQARVQLSSILTDLTMGCCSLHRSTRHVC